MSRAWPLVLLVLLLPASAYSDSSNLEGGVFIAHHPPGLQYTSGQDWCARYFQEFAIDSCSQQNNRIDLDGNDGEESVWFVLAAWDEEKQWCGTEFGFADYDSTIYLFDQWGPCPSSALGIPTPGWPGPNTGIALSLPDTTWTGNFVPVCWFAGYAYDQGTISLAVNSATGFGGTANCETPPVAHPATTFGGMGLFQDGTSVCPEGLDQGQGGLYGGDGDSQEQDQGQGEYAEPPYTPPRNPSAVVSAYVDPAAISFGNRGWEMPVESVNFNLSALRDTLIAVGAQTIRPAFPQATLADTLGHDTNGQPVMLPDISSFYHIEFADPDSAVMSIPTLRRTPGIRYAEALTALDPVVDFPNDRHFRSWQRDSSDTTYLHDPQWFLENNGLRPAEGHCGHAVAGADMHAQGAWPSGLGDPTTVIGMVDMGVFGGADSCHEDLRVLSFSRAERALFTTHPDDDLCGTHGTRMSGIAAALTDNDSVGIAGVCGNCSLMDIESASNCNWPAQDWGYFQGGGPHSWYANIAAACALPLPDARVLRVLNMSGGYDNTWLSLESITALWQAFATDVVFVNSAGNTNSPSPRTKAPANLSFVLGVGGTTWEGKFWDRNTTCYSAPDTGGTTVGYSDFSRFGGQSGRTCDVCAPTCGRYVTTEPLNRNPGYSGYYWFTTGQTSGASAQGAGLAGLVQSLAHERFAEDICADDVIGIIEATATPWPAGNHPSSYAICRGCPAEFFGNGVINAEGAAALVTDYSSLWRPGADADFCERIAGKSGDIVPGSWHFAIVDSEAVQGTMWVEFRAEAQVALPSRFTGPPREDPLIMPEYVAWVRRNARSGSNPQYLKTNTFSSYSRDMATRVAMMQGGMTDCRLSIIDQADGTATISGYTYAYRSSPGGALVQLVPEDSVRMAYVVMCNTPVGVEEPVSAEAGGAMTLTGRECQGRTNVRCSLFVSDPGSVRVEVVDVTGRIVHAFDLGPVTAGSYEVRWDGREDGRARVSAGVYWVRAVKDGATCAKRLLLVGR